MRLMLPLTGFQLVRLPPLRTKVHVVHAGLSQLLPPSNLLKESRVPVLPHSPNNNSLIVPVHSVTKVVMVVGWIKLSNMLLSMVSPILPHILIPLEIKPVSSMVVTTISPDLRMPLKETVMPLSMISVEDPFQ